MIYPLLVWDLLILLHLRRKYIWLLQFFSITTVIVNGLSLLGLGLNGFFMIGWVWFLFLKTQWVLHMKKLLLSNLLVCCLHKSQNYISTIKEQVHKYFWSIIWKVDTRNHFLVTWYQRTKKYIFQICSICISCYLGNLWHF